MEGDEVWLLAIKQCETLQGLRRIGAGIRDRQPPFDGPQLERLREAYAARLVILKRGPTPRK